MDEKKPDLHAAAVALAAAASQATRAKTQYPEIDAVLKEIGHHLLAAAQALTATDQDAKG